MIKCKNISKIYKTKDYNIAANKNISLEIKDGEIVWVAGVSGAGKSTLLHILSSIDIPTEGAVYWNDKEVSRLSDKERSSFRLLNIGLILQSLELLKTQSVFDNVALPLKFLNESSSNINKKVNEILENLKIDNLKKKKPEQLSGGQKQRVAIARALALEPEILLCDEATSALDPQTTKQILNLLKKINKELGITIVLVTHQMEVVKEICQRIAIIQKGKLLEVGKTEDLFLSSSSALKTLVDDQPILPKDGKSIKLYFPRQYTGDSLITRMARELNIDFSIVWGKLENFGDDVLGSLVINVKDKDFTVVLSYIKNEKISFEVLESEGN